MRVGNSARWRRWLLGGVGVLLGLLVVARVVLGERVFRSVPGIGEIWMSFAPYPQLWINNNYGNCGSNQVIDGDGRSWGESGCEARSSGWSRGERMDAARHQKFQNALAELNKVADRGPGEQRCNSTKYLGVLRIVLRLDKQRTREWWICADPAERPPEFERLWEAMYGGR